MQHARAKQPFLSKGRFWILLVVLLLVTFFFYGRATAAVATNVSTGVGHDGAVRAVSVHASTSNIVPATPGSGTLLVAFSSAAVPYSFLTVYPADEQPTAELERLSSVESGAGTSALLEVPQICQFDVDGGGSFLSSGCEVTSLTMILQNVGIEVTKEELAEAIPKESLIDDDGLAGNPNYGFVGDMEGWGIGYSVYHGPIADMARRYTDRADGLVADLTGQGFSVVLDEVSSGIPVWVIVDAAFAPSQDFEVWDTAEGPLAIDWNIHSVVVTGYDDDYVYVNDPYLNESNEPVDRADFEQSWKQMGSQAVIVRSA